MSWEIKFYKNGFGADKENQNWCESHISQIKKGLYFYIHETLEKEYVIYIPNITFQRLSDLISFELVTNKFVSFFSPHSPLKEVGFKFFLYDLHSALELTDDIKFFFDEIVKGTKTI